MKKIAISLIILSTLSIFSCDDPGNDPSTVFSSLFVNRSQIDPGPICLTGGVQIDMGFDQNQNNVLDSNEITKTEYVCNGEDASSHPFVVYTSPTPNESDVNLSASLRAVFNTEMDPDTVNVATFTLKDQSSSSVSGVISYNGTTALFQPVEPLKIKKKYSFTLSSIIKNLLDIETGYDHTIYFTTGNATALYRANGADNGTVPVDGNSYDEGDIVTVMGNEGSLEKSDHVFIGWNTRQDLSGDSYADGDMLSVIDTNIILYAMWAEKYKVFYDGNGADSGNVPVDSNDYLYDQDVTIKGNDGNLVKDLYSFTGWNTEQDGSGIGYSAGSILKMGITDITLYAQWTELPKYIVIYDGNGNTDGSVPVDNNEYMETMEVTVMENTGNLLNDGDGFVGWNTAANGSGIDYVAGDIFSMGTSDVTLFAKWLFLVYLVMDTGQTEDYTTTFGEDSDYINVPDTRSYTGPTQHSTYINDYTTKDNVTKLLWKTCSEGLTGAACTGTVVAYSWENAKTTCTALNSVNSNSGYAGRTDWRLPAIEELETLPDYGKHDPAINEVYFPGTVSNQYWSSSKWAGSTSLLDIWIIDFRDGSTADPSATVEAFSRCVAGPE